MFQLLKIYFRNRLINHNICVILRININVALHRKGYRHYICNMLEDELDVGKIDFIIATVKALEADEGNTTPSIFVRTFSDFLCT